MSMEVMALPANADSPIVVTVFGIIIDVNGHPLNAAAPIVVKELPKTILERLVLANADSPIVITVFGILTEVRLELFSNAPSPMCFYCIWKRYRNQFRTIVERTATDSLNISLNY